MFKLAFINAIKGQAIRDMNSYGILASITIAQAILESGWGESTLTTKANNLFGIKASSSWTGDTIEMNTMEYKTDGTPYMIKARFRKYDSWADSIKDHTELLRKPLYYPVRQAKDYKTGCYALTVCGYATDPQYYKDLIKIIEENKLQEFDIKQGGLISKMDNMDVKELQEFLNKIGCTDDEGKMLVVDGVHGRRTEQARQKAKRLIIAIEK